MSLLTRLTLSIVVVAGSWEVAGRVAFAQQQCPNGQFLTLYFNNTSMTGQPVYRRCESRINNDWGTGAPTKQGGGGDPKADSAGARVPITNNDNFSVLWTGRFWFNAGNYSFIAQADDGIKVGVDNQLIIDQWQDQSLTEYKANCELSTGLHRVWVRYYEHEVDAVARVWWERNP